MTKDEIQQRAEVSARKDPIISLSEAAEELGLSFATVRNLVDVGVLPHVKYGKLKRVRMSSIIRLRTEIVNNKAQSAQNVKDE